MPALETLTDRPSRSALESVVALRSALKRITGLLVVLVRVVSFWVATLLPLTYLPLLGAGVVAEHPTAFLALLCVNAVAFVLGHEYRRPDVA